MKKIHLLLLSLLLGNIPCFPENIKKLYHQVHDLSPKYDSAMNRLALGYTFGIFLGLIGLIKKYDDMNAPEPPDWIENEQAQPKELKEDKPKNNEWFNFANIALLAAALSGGYGFYYHRIFSVFKKDWNQFKHRFKEWFVEFNKRYKDRIFWEFLMPDNQSDMKELERMMLFPDFYEEFGFSRDITPQKFRQQYHSLSRKYHPDKTSRLPQKERDAAAEKMKTLNLAKEVFSDSRKKVLYDDAQNLKWGNKLVDEHKEFKVPVYFPGF